MIKSETLSAKEVAAYLEMSPRAIRANGDALGGFKIGNGRNSIWLFPVCNLPERIRAFVLAKMDN